MPDQRTTTGDPSQELIFTREQGFFDKSKAIRFFILLIFAITLFVFLHFREVQVEVLELNHISPGYIVSQVDFDFSDDEATLIMRQDALKDIGKIYRLSEKDIRQKRIEFEHFLLFNHSWHEQSEEASFEKLYQGIDTLEKALVSLRFTDAGTYEKINSLHLPIKDYIIYIPNTLLDQVLIPSFIWELIRKEDLPQKTYTPFISSLILEFFKYSHWHIEEDINAERILRKKIQSLVSEKMTHVAAGSRIIDQGEKVTSRHLAMLQAMKNQIAANRNLFHPETLLGTFIMTLLSLGIFLTYFRINQPQILGSNRQLFLLVTILVFTLAIAKLSELFLLKSQINLIESIRYPLFAPLAGILLSCLISLPVAAFSSAFIAILSTVSLAFDWEGFLVLNLVASFVAILNIHSLRRRKEIIVVCLKAWVACVAVILSLHMYNNVPWSWAVMGDILSACFSMLFTAILVVGLLPLLESAFGIMTDVSLMEYLDPNNDLLRRLTLEAPGTYQHSVVVGNLAEAASVSIGANGLFCRVATLYHDVGKMATSQYFTENQLGDVNIHQLLTPQESAHVIMAHVPEGVAMARAAGLPEPIIDIIKEHHGTTLVYFFYRKQLEQMGGDKTKVDDREFRYPGPKPHTKESGIIMIADSFEAASRSQDKVNEESLMLLIDRIIREKIEDGQFEDCNLTFHELSVVKKALVKTLLAAGHARVKYPMHERKESCCAD